jgi:hypothetical protein
MAGKTKKPNSWGGKREGSGRKPAYMITDNQVKAMLKTAKKRAQEEGKTIDDVLMDIIYNRQAYEVEKPRGKVELVIEVPPKDRITAIKVFKEYTIGKRIEKESHNHNYQHEGPAIGLPPMREDPALKIVKSGK